MGEIDGEPNEPMTCPDCNGTGVVDGLECDTCDGDGCVETADG